MNNTNNIMEVGNNSLYARKYQILKKFMQQEPYDFCAMNISTRVADVLRGVLDQKAVAFFKTVGHRKDNRTNEEFAQDLVMSRILEVYIIDYFKSKHGKSLELNGCDKEDVLDTKNRISTEPDLIAKDGSYIEVVSDKFGFWKKNNGFDLRDYKYNHLIELSKKTAVYILAIDLLERRYQLLRVDDRINAVFVKEIKEFGYKDGYHINIYEKNYRFFE